MPVLDPVRAQVERVRRTRCYVRPTMIYPTYGCLFYDLDLATDDIVRLQPEGEEARLVVFRRGSVVATAGAGEEVRCVYDAPRDAWDIFVLALIPDDPYVTYGAPVG